MKTYLRLIPCFILGITLSAAPGHTALALPEGFTYLDEVDPTIILSSRYATDHNFIGSPITGYDNARVVLTQQAAEALKKIQQILKQNGYGLVVYDGYRPQKAVDQFMKWSTDSSDQKMKNQYYPYVDKAKVFELGYVAEKSGHSRGSTVDISIIDSGKTLQPIIESKRELTDGREVLFLDDGTVDMGTSFDLFDEASHHDTKLVSEEALKKRNFLREVMLSNGFKEYHEEWWHYTLKEEPFPSTYFDFNK